MKQFNTTTVCIPSKHYMVNLSQRVKEIKKMVDDGKYFIINRARQYGKSTTLLALKKFLATDYIVLPFDFQKMNQDVFETGTSFAKTLAQNILDLHEFEDLEVPAATVVALENFMDAAPEWGAINALFRIFKRWIKASARPLVMMIDEVDSASNNQIFLDFLSQLRADYISREGDGVPAFQSVILAGVTDIRYLQVKIRDESQHRLNSPWNVAANFNIDMSLSEEGIRGMLNDYEADHHTGMDTAVIAKLIREYTEGYPFLVSRICQIIDTELTPGKFKNLAEAWSRRGMDEAIKLLLSESNPLFQSLTAKLNNFPKLKDALHDILMEGTRLSYNIQQDEIAQMKMYGFIRNENNAVVIANRIFETLLYNYFLSDEELKKSPFFHAGTLALNQFVKNGRLDMRLILERFIVTYHQVCGPLKDKFTEKDGRELFLLYLKPIINGTGNYYIEAQTRDQTRTDVIVDYLGEQYIIELKIWRGERYNEEGEKQITEYLNYFNLDTGYMLSFNFNQKKEPGVKRISVGGKTLFEGTV